MDEETPEEKIPKKTILIVATLAVLGMGLILSVIEAPESSLYRPRDVDVEWTVSVTEDGTALSVNKTTPSVPWLSWNPVTEDGIGIPHKISGGTTLQAGDFMLLKGPADRHDGAWLDFEDRHYYRIWLPRETPTDA